MFFDAELSEMRAKNFVPLGPKFGLATCPGEFLSIFASPGHPRSSMG
jgi:hypothetical protein